MTDKREVASTSSVVSEQIADHLRQMILNDTLLPGERIRQEAIAHELGVSRLPVREALRILESEGLTELKANTGARVSRMNLAECVAVYKIRERIEPLALAESIPHLTDLDIETLDEIHNRIQNLASDDLVNFFTLDQELHKLTYTGCRIPQLRTMVDRFWNTTQHYRRAFLRVNGPEKAWIINAEHGLLIEAIKNRDTVEAEQILSGHIRRTYIQFEKHPELFER